MNHTDIGRLRRDGDDIFFFDGEGWAFYSTIEQHATTITGRNWLAGDSMIGYTDAYKSVLKQCYETIPSMWE